MGIYFNPSDEAYRQDKNGQICVDKTDLIAILIRLYLPLRNISVTAVRTASARPLRPICCAHTMAEGVMAERFLGGAGSGYKLRMRSI